MMIIRNATPSDAYQFVEIKNQLSFKDVNGETTSGGFLLGTTLNIYKKYIETEYCMVAELEGKIVGFGIVFRNKTLKKLDIWEKRNLAKWTTNIELYEQKKVCYFEQLAFLNGHSRTVIKLAYQLMKKAFKTHTHMFTTTVHSPILNLSAVPYILKIGGEKIGGINENYPEIGKIVSDIYKVEKSDFIKTSKLPKWKKFLAQK